MTEGVLSWQKNITCRIITNRSRAVTFYSHCPARCFRVQLHENPVLHGVKPRFSAGLWSVMPESFRRRFHRGAGIWIREKRYILLASPGRIWIMRLRRFTGHFILRLRSYRRRRDYWGRLFKDSGTYQGFYPKAVYRQKVRNRCRANWSWG